MAGYETVPTSYWLGRRRQEGRELTAGGVGGAPLRPPGKESNKAASSEGKDLTWGPAGLGARGGVAGGFGSRVGGNLSPHIPTHPLGFFLFQSLPGHPLQEIAQASGLTQVRANRDPTVKWKRFPYQ